MLSDRRAKLTNLRMRMHVELVGEESNLVRPSSSSALLGIDRTGDNFDKLSLASWGKNLLRNSIDSTPSHNTLSPLDQQGSMQVVVPEDTISTKGVEAIRMPSESPLKTAPETKPKSGAYPDPQQASCSTAALYSLPPPSAGVALLKRYNTVAGDDRSSATTSSASSKSSSLDRQTSVTMGGVVGGLALSLSQSPGGPGDKIGSLGSIASDFGSGRSSKSNSLNRDGLPRDEAHATEMERRNSEIVDALAFELVPEASALPPDRLPDLPEEDQESTTNRSDSNSQQPSPNPAPQQPSVSSPPASDHPPDCTTQDPLVVTSASSRAPFVSCSSSFSSSTLTPVTVPSSPTPFMTPTADSQPASIAALDPGAKPRNSGDRPLGRPDVPNGHRQPDVVASCRLLKSAEGKMSVDNSGAGKTDGSAGSPIPPPRRRRTKDSLEDDVEESEVSIHVEPATPRVVLPKLDIKAARERSNTTPNHATTASVYRQYSGDGAEDRYMTGPTGTMRRKMSDPTSVKADPLSLHIMRITGNMDQSGDGNSDIESEDGVSDVSSEMGHKAESKEYLASAKVKTAKYKRLLSHTVRKTGMKIASKIKKTSDHYRHKNEARFESDDEDLNSEAGRVITVRASHHNKGPYNFDQLRLAQDLSGEHSGAIWCVKFSLCGRLMATAGQDNLIRIWVVKDAFDYFNNMRRKYNAETAASGGTTSSADIAMFAARAPSAASQLPRHRSPGSARAFRPSKDNSKQAGSVTPSATPTVHKSSWKHPLAPIQRDESFVSMSEASVVSGPSSSVCPNTAPSVIDEESWWPFRPEPFCFYRGHTADVLDVAWSKNYFLLSSSMDRTVRLWHVSRDECLCCFQHIDFVTAIAFLPRDDRYFLSGCLDGKLRLWNIPEKKVALWNEIDNGTLITAMTFVKNGKFVVVGTFDGRCIFYSTDNLKYFTQLDVKSSRRKNARGHKITGLEASPDKLLVTSNDSRIRLYDFTDLSLTCKYKGCSNGSSQIKAGFSPDGRYIICGSEDKSIYIWKTVMDVLTLSVRKDRNKMWESIRAHNAIVTAGVFAPKPELIFKQVDNARRQSGDVASLMGFSEADIDDTTSRISINSSVSSIRRPSLRKTKNNVGDVIVSADFTGCLYVFLNKPKIKTGSSIFLPSFAPR